MHLLEKRRAKVGINWTLLSTNTRHKVSHTPTPWESGFVLAYCKVSPHALSQHFSYWQLFAKFRPMQKNFHGKK